MELKLHQEECIENIRENFINNKKGLIKMFCGSGKSLIIYHSLLEYGKKLSIVVVPSINLITQFNNDYMLNPKTIQYNNNNFNKIFKMMSICSKNEVENQIENLKVLIAEDDETSDALITRVIKKNCKEVLHSKTGFETVEICRNNSDIDFVLMDIRMPDMNGYEAARQIRQFNKTVVIIAQTAFGLTGDRKKAIDAGCNDYLSKPIDNVLLMALIQKHLIVKTG